MNLKLQQQDEQVLLKWWHWLDDNRGHRARLRRATIADDVMLTSAFFEFLSYRAETKEGSAKLCDSWREAENLFVSAMVCGLLSRVQSESSEQIEKQIFNKTNRTLEKKKAPAEFAELLAKPNKGGSSPIMSELRFQRLQKSRSPDEFYLQMSRAIDLLGGSVPILSLVNDIIDWCREYEIGLDKNPQKRLAVRWATEYYTTLKSKSA